MCVCVDQSRQTRVGLIFQEITPLYLCPSLHAPVAIRLNLITQHTGCVLVRSTTHGTMWASISRWKQLPHLVLFGSPSTACCICNAGVVASTTSRILPLPLID